MTKRNPKPQTPLAKADAAITVANRKVYAEWDSDAIRFGVRVADFNAGYIAGSTRHKAKKRK